MAGRRFWEELRGRLEARTPLSRAAFICMIGFVLFSPFSISVAQLFGYAGAVAWLASVNFEPNIFRNRFPLFWPWLVFAFLTLASAATAEGHWKSLWDARKLFQIFLFYFAVNVVRDEWEADRLARALFLSAAAASAWTLAASLAGPLSLARRMSGFFSIYMTLGGYLMVAGTAALAYLFVFGRDRRAWWVYPAAALMGAALLGTLSRNAWIGLAVAVAALALAGRSWKVLAAAAAVAALAWVVAPDSLRSRVLSLADAKDPTRVERLLMWESGLRIALDHPLLGAGPGRIKREYPAYANPKAQKQRTGHLHNNLLHLAAERGFPALAAWLWAFGGYFWLVGRCLRGLEEAPPGRRFRTLAGLAAAAGFFAAGLFEYNFGDSEVLMIAFFAMALPFMAEEKKGG
ncbi:MAG: O-antigen ligase family protein [Candidatus Tectomicrobia bacterium]|uniref:O-antigen ligase family protein n=1 Tax=Tectimicrobiota bacterium TaxID=2528274 RepID=A0A932MN83_UNCTE|nr:O-antigen ligase family protein [Candidatus Tectomicrobia bacterium]